LNSKYRKSKVQLPRTQDNIIYESSSENHHQSSSSHLFDTKSTAVAIVLRPSRDDLDNLCHFGMNSSPNQSTLKSTTDGGCVFSDGNHATAGEESNLYEEIVESSKSNVGFNISLE